MKLAISLMYHDVVERAMHQASGFGSAHAALYKLEPDQFKRHLAAIGKAVADSPILVTDLVADKARSARPWPTSAVVRRPKGRRRAAAA